MRQWIPRAALGLALLAGLLIGIRLAASPLTSVELAQAEEAPPARSVPAPSRRLDSLGAAAVARNPFRITRQPAPVAYDPFRPDQQYAPSAPPKPMLALVGIVAGESPTAVIEGFPGIEGSRVVRVGDVIGGLKVEGITGHQVRVVGMDTTWVLRVREPWK
jgi:hypothetical protein